MCSINDYQNRKNQLIKEANFLKEKLEKRIKKLKTNENWYKIDRLARSCDPAAIEMAFILTKSTGINYNWKPVLKDYQCAMGIYLPAKVKYFKEYIRRIKATLKYSLTLRSALMYLTAPRRIDMFISLRKVKEVNIPAENTAGIKYIKSKYPNIKLNIV